MNKVEHLYTFLYILTQLFEYVYIRLGYIIWKIIYPCLFYLFHETPFKPPFLETFAVDFLMFFIHFMEFFKNII